MKTNREPKKKPYRSALSNAFWNFRQMRKDAPQALALMVAEVPVNVFLAWADVKLPALVVVQVMSGEALERAALRIGAFIGLMFLLSVTQRFLYSVSFSYLMRYRMRKGVEVDRKSMRCFFQTFEKKQTRDLHDRAHITVEMWNGEVPIADMPERSLKLVENILCYCLFGSMVFFVSPWLVPLLTLAPVVNWLCQRAYQKWEYGTRAQRADLDRKHDYAMSKPADFRAAKDIRVYAMADWFRQVYADLFTQRNAWTQRCSLRQFFSRVADLCVILLRDGAAYALLIAMALNGEITIDEFVLYFAAISTFATYVGNIMKQWTDMNAASLKVCDFREYMDLPERDGTGEARASDHLASAPEITFDHVSFRYDGADADTLRDVSFTIHPGEKVALVGLNGAGKTTLVKLLCGLYLPTAGDIRINGVSVREFLRDDYYRLFSPVFQDVHTAFFSLADTVSGCLGGGGDPARAEQCMRRAGLGRKLDALPRGIHTKLDKQINKDGVELSGGELQKLMLARALYKDAPILVLDEPTAALDPIAENEIYLQYREMTQSKTSLFISHRLATTQFCDRILFLQNGRIIEEGNHAELTALGGEYSRLYEMQSCWYREDYQGGEAQ